MSWHFLEDSKNLVEGRPNRLFFKGQAIVVFQVKKTYRAFLDYCPHRGFPLSEGLLEKTGEEYNLKCSYHGWSFDSLGNLLARPGFVEGLTPKLCLKSFAIRNFGELLFISDHSETALPTWMTNLEEAEMDGFRHSCSIKAQKIHILENLLDPLHTHYIHAPFLRASSDRVSVDVKARYQSTEQCLSVEYLNEATPKGIISQIFEGQRSKTIGKYFHPDVAVLEYWSPAGLDLRVSLFVSERKERMSAGSLVFQFKKAGFFRLVKKPMFKFFTGILVRQDFRVLEEQARNLEVSRREAFWISDEDMVFKTIKQLYAGTQIADFEANYKMNL